VILARWPHAMKTRRHPESRKYTSYRNAVRKGPSHGYRQHSQKELVKIVLVGFEFCERSDRQTDRQTDKRTYSSQCSAGRSNYQLTTNAYARSCAIAEGPRDVLVSRNLATTNYAVSSSALLKGQFVIPMLSHHMMNQCTKFKVSSFGHFGDILGGLRI